MRFSKYNTKRKPKRKMDRTTADIMAGKQMLEDTERGVVMPLKYYDELSDKLCGKPSRSIF